MVDELTPREQDAVIAEWCGYCLGDMVDDIPFSTDLNAMARALDVVRERGLDRLYAYHLAWHMIGAGPMMPHKEGAERILMDGDIFTIATATAPQRAEAMVRMIEVQGSVEYNASIGTDADPIYNK